MNKYNYNIRSTWWDSVNPPNLLATAFLDTIDSLATLDPLMQDWLVLDYLTLETEPLSKARSNMTVLAQHGVATDDYEKPDPSNGYTQTAFAGNPELDPQHIDLTVKSGSKWDNRVDFGIGSIGIPSDTELVTYQRYRTTLEIIAKYWPCPWLCAYAFEVNYPERLKDKDKAFAYSRYHITWIGYLSAPFAQGLKPPRELACEHTPGGGVILSATRERLDPDNQDHLHCARLLADLMVERAGVGGPGPDWGPRTGPY